MKLGLLVVPLVVALFAPQPALGGGGCGRYRPRCDAVLKVAVFWDAKFATRTDEALGATRGSYDVSELLKVVVRSAQNFLLKENLGRTVKLHVGHAALYERPDGEDEADADKLLGDFCSFQAGHGSRAAWDLAVLFTGHDLYLTPEGGDKNLAVRGKSNQGSVCGLDKAKSCLVVESTQAHTMVVALLHEIGHSLGMTHDDDDPTCKASPGIMSASLRSVDIDAKPVWSGCSRSAVERLFAGAGAGCLVNDLPATDDLFDVHFFYPVSGDEQCRFAFGKDYRMYAGWAEGKAANCLELSCENPATSTVQTQKGAWALDGTDCNDDTTQRCWRNKCTRWDMVEKGNPCWNCPDMTGQDRLYKSIVSHIVGIISDFCKLFWF